MFSWPWPQLILLAMPPPPLFYWLLPCQYLLNPQQTKIDGLQRASTKRVLLDARLFVFIKSRRSQVLPGSISWLAARKCFKMVLGEAIVTICVFVFLGKACGAHFVTICMCSTLFCLFWQVSQSRFRTQHKTFSCFVI